MGFTIVAIAPCEQCRNRNLCEQPFSLLLQKRLVFCSGSKNDDAGFSYWDCIFLRPELNMLYCTVCHSRFGSIPRYRSHSPITLHPASSHDTQLSKADLSLLWLAKMEIKLWNIVSYLKIKLERQIRCLFPLNPPCSFNLRSQICPKMCL